MRKFLTAKSQTIPARGWVTAAAVALALPVAGEAGTVIDWLTFAPGSDRNHFGLLNDSGQTSALAEIQIVAGALVPGLPGPGTLQSDFWTDPLDYIDSVQGDGTLSTTKLQVAPRAGGVRFQLDVRGGDLSGMVIAVGQLFNSEADGTRELGLLSKTLSGVIVALEYLGAEQWDNGVRFYDQPLAWDGMKLTLGPNAIGESGFAFFRVQSGIGPVTQLLFEVPDGYALGNGDAVEFAFGLTIPEPVAPVLALVGGMVVACRRRTARRLPVSV